MSQFDKLMAEMDDILAKAQPVMEPAKGDEDEEEADKRPAAKDGEDKGDDDMMKSFRVTLDDGSEVEAYDATAMLKAMHARAATQADALASVQADLAAAHKVIAAQTSMLKSIGDRLTEQSDMLKALREQPAGRRSAAAAPAAPAPAALKGEDVLAKALTAQSAGRLSAVDVASIEARLTSGIPLKPEHLAVINAA